MSSKAARQMHQERPSATVDAAHPLTAQTSALLEAVSRGRGDGQPLPPPLPTRMDAEFGHDFTNMRVYPGPRAAQAAEGSLRVQAKLEVGAVDDPSEREADQIAQAITAPTPEDARQPCACGATCAKCQAKATLQRAAEPQAPALSAIAPESVLEDLGSGQPLDAATRAYFEPRFGFDFSSVRVHTDDRAAQSAQALRAIAYTAGRDIVFAPGRYAPESTQGQQLLAHELAHVVQQGQGRTRSAVQRSSESFTDRALDYIAAGCISKSKQESDQFEQRYREKTQAPTPGPVYDAFGHCFTACCVTQSSSSRRAAFLGGLRENLREIGYGDDEDGKHDSYSQDTRNQEIGRSLGADKSVSCADACAQAASPTTQGNGPPGRKLDLSAPITRYKDGTELGIAVRHKVVAVKVVVGGSPPVERTVQGVTKGQAITVNAPQLAGSLTIPLSISISLSGSPSPLYRDTVNKQTVQVDRRSAVSSSASLIDGSVEVVVSPDKSVAVQSADSVETVQWTSDSPVTRGQYTLRVRGGGDNAVKSRARISIDGANVGRNSDFTFIINLGP